VAPPCSSYENSYRSISYLRAFLRACRGVRNSTPRCDGGRADGGGAALVLVAFAVVLLTALLERATMTTIPTTTVIMTMTMRPTVSSG
jgi:uncharacterized membrane protein YhhN